MTFCAFFVVQHGLSITFRDTLHYLYLFTYSSAVDPGPRLASYDDDDQRAIPWWPNFLQ